MSLWWGHPHSSMGFTVHLSIHKEVALLLQVHAAVWAHKTGWMAVLVPSFHHRSSVSPSEEKKLSLMKLSKCMNTIQRRTIFMKIGDIFSKKTPSVRTHAECCTHTMPVPHLSQRGSFCSEEVVAWGFVTGAFTLLVTMGLVPVRKIEEKPSDPLWEREMLPHINSSECRRLREWQVDWCH